MNAWLEQTAAWCWQNSLPAGALAAGLYLLRTFVRRRPAPHWFYLGGWLVMLRLVLPGLLYSPWSWDRLRPLAAPVEEDAAIPALAVSSAGDVREFELQAASEASPPLAIEPHAGLAETMATPAVRPAVVVARAGIDWRSMAVAVWAVGVAGGFGIVVGLHCLFLRRLRRIARPVAGKWRGLAGECASVAGLRRAPELLALPGGGSPFLTGVRRPVIVLPEVLLATLTEQEMRCVLLHEMLHISRRDLAANWMLVGLRALHWWNPLIHLAARRLLADREILRDRQALALLNDPAAASGYGELLLKLGISPQLRAAPYPGCAPFFHSEKELTRRIAMIASPHPARRMAGLLTAAAVLTLSVPVFTTAHAETTKPDALTESGVDSPEVAAPETTPLVSVEVDRLLKIGALVNAPRAEAVGRLHAIAADLRSRNLIADADAIEAEIRALTGTTAPQTAVAPVVVSPELAALSAEVEKLKIRVLVKEGTTENFLPQYQKDRMEYHRLVNSGLGAKHPKVIGLRNSIEEEKKILDNDADEYILGLEAQTSGVKDALTNLGAVGIYLLKHGDPVVLTPDEKLIGLDGRLIVLTEENSIVGRWSPASGAMKNADPDAGVRDRKDKLIWRLEFERKMLREVGFDRQHPRIKAVDYAMETIRNNPLPDVKGGKPGRER